MALAVLVLSGCESSRVLSQVQETLGFPRSVTDRPAAPPAASIPEPPAAPSTAAGSPPPSAAPADPTVSPTQRQQDYDLSQFLLRQQQAVPTVPTAPVAAPPPLRRRTGGTIRVGVLLPLSGSFAATGRALRNAAQMALFDAADEHFELVFHDTEGTPEGAVNAANVAIGEGVSLIVGPLLSGEVTAVRPAARAAGVSVITFSNDRSVAGGGVYTMGFLPGDQIRRVVSYARSRGITRFAILAPESPYGATAVAAMQQAVAGVGGQLTQVKRYDPNTTDFNPVVRDLGDYERRRGSLIAQRRDLEARGDELARQALRRLDTLQTVGDLPFQALMVADGGKRLQEIAALLPVFDIDPAKIRILGTQLWDSPGTGTEPALIGGWYAAPPPQNRTAFEVQYKQNFGEEPPKVASLAYDATALAALLARGGGATFTTAALTAASGYMGHDGIFRLTPAGTVERGLAVLEVQQQEPHRVISPAPETFAAVTN